MAVEVLISDDLFNPAIKNLLVNGELAGSVEEKNGLFHSHNIFKNTNKHFGTFRAAKAFITNSILKQNTNQIGLF